MTLPSGSTEFRGGRGRAVFAGSYTQVNTTVMDFVKLQQQEMHKTLVI